jgi:translation initiation factor 1 (eIF-1/SUI1)
MNKTLRIIAIVAGVLALIFLALIIWAAIAGQLLNFLYIVLIILAFFLLFSTGCLIFAVFRLIGTITTVRNELKPLLASVQQTVGIVQDTARTAGKTVTTINGTAQLASQFAVGPTIRTAAVVVAGQEVLRVFVGKGRTKSRWEERRRQQMEAIAKGAE